MLLFFWGGDVFTWRFLGVFFSMVILVFFGAFLFFFSMVIFSVVCVFLCFCLFVFPPPVGFVHCLSCLMFLRVFVSCFPLLVSLLVC